MGGDHLDASLKAIHGALKTGGMLGVEDHREGGVNRVRSH